jgi:surface protein
MKKLFFFLVALLASVAVNATNAEVTPDVSKLAWEPDAIPVIFFEDPLVEDICLNNWDTDRNGLLSVYEAAEVTDLGWAFAWESITSFNELKYFTSLTGIGDWAFEGCYDLESITIPASVTSIGDYAFYDCFNLTSVTVEWEEPIEVSWGVFDYIYDATLYVPFGTASAYRDADVWGDFGNIVEYGSPNIDFADPKVKEICVNNWDTNGDGELSMDEAAAVTDLIGAFAWENITSFNELKYFTSLTSIGEYAFINCYYLKSITIPVSVTSIGDYAFSSCSNLTSVTVGWEKPLAVDRNVFDDVPLNNATLYVPAWTEDTYHSDEVWNSFGRIVGNPIILFADSKVKMICVAKWDTDGDGELSIDEAAAVTDLGETFSYNTNITSFNELKYFTGLTTITMSAFRECSNLASIVIPSNVTSIGYVAFIDCYSLTSIVIPAKVTSISTRVFEECASLTSIVVDKDNTVFDSREGCNAIIKTANNELIEACQTTFIPNSVKSIGDFAFFCRRYINSIEIPNGVTTIGEDAFGFCTRLTSITVPASVTSIGESIFNYCSKLSSITVASGNTVYDSRNNCNAIIETSSNILRFGCKNTVIPNSVTKIGYDAFQGCSNLTSIDIPSSVTSIGGSAFRFCTRLASIDIPNSVTDIGKDAFGYCYDLTTVNIGNGLKSIGDWAFEGCYSLQSINFPDGLTSIGETAFEDCNSLTSINIPSSVTSIGGGAFGGCSGLTSVTVNWVEPYEESYLFWDVPLEEATLYVPAGTKAAYESSEMWNEFGNIVEMEDDESEAYVAELISELRFYYNGERSEFEGSLPTYSLNQNDEWPGWGMDIDDEESIRDIWSINFDESFAKARPTSTFRWFAYMEAMEWITGLQYLNTSEVKNMSMMFFYLDRMESIDVSHFNTSKCTDMSAMFTYCSSLKELDLSSFDTSNCEDMSGMFYDCESLESLDVSNFVVPSDPENTSDIFGGCSGLKTLKISSSMEDLYWNACEGVGSPENPCVIIAPEGFNFGIDTSGDYFEWKGGYFCLEKPTVVETEGSNIHLGRKFDVIVGMNTGNGNYNGYQFELCLPEGFHLQEQNGQYVYTLSDRFNGDGISVSISDDNPSAPAEDTPLMASGQTAAFTTPRTSSSVFYNVVVSTTGDEVIKGNDGELIRLVAVADKDVDRGEHEGYISDAFLTTTEGGEETVEPDVFHLVIPEYDLGDVNTDNVVDVTDVMVVVNHILGNSLSNYDGDYADMNDDGIVDVTDIMLIVSVILDPERVYAPAFPTQEGLSLSMEKDATLVSVTFASGYTACQMTVHLTDGMRLTGARLCGEDNDACHMVRTTQLPDGSWRVLVYSSDAAPLRSSEEGLLRLTTSGTGHVSLSDVLFTTQQCESVSFSEVSTTTGIGDATAGSSSAGDIYDLSGRRHTTTPQQSGIYIKNGKLCSVKK